MSQHHFRFRRLPSKRKLEDYDTSSSSSQVRRNSISEQFAGNSIHDCEFQSTSDEEINGASELDFDTTSFQIQFFVRMLFGETLVIRANFGDTVDTVHRRIHERRRISPELQRLIYKGKQLQSEQTLEQCGIQNDAEVHLVGRMRSTDHPRAWRLLSDMVSMIGRYCRKEITYVDPSWVKKRMEQFMALPIDKSMDFKANDYVAFERQMGYKNNKAWITTKRCELKGEFDGDTDDDGLINKYDFCQIFMDACAPQCLIVLYLSEERRYKDCASHCIRSFVDFVKDLEGCWGERAYCAKPVLEFCKLLRMMVPEDDLLYKHCRSTLGSMLEKAEVRLRREGEGDRYDFVVVTDGFPFLKEIEQKLIKDLEQSVVSDTGAGPVHQDVCDFSAFLQPMLVLIGEELAAAKSPSTSQSAKGITRQRTEESTKPLASEVDHLLLIFNDLLCWLEKGLHKVKLSLAMKKKKAVEAIPSGRSQYLAILKALYSISLLYPGSEDRFWSTMRQNKAGVCSLIVNYANRSDDNSWLHKHRDILDFDSKRHLALLLFPEVREDYEEMHEMMIDRSNMLAESFEYMSNAPSSSLHAGIFMQFKNEVATGPGVLREWFCLVCQALFNPQNALFVSCPSDRRRFFPSPASKVHSLHLPYFKFAGRVVALALMYKIQVGVVLDRVFFLQLAGRLVSVEDVRDADPCLYSSCKQILEMDAEFVDSDSLGLTFVTEAEDLGTRKVVELCPGGKDIVVNSKNRKEYVNLIVQHRFVTSIAEQVSCFAKGFSDILSEGKVQESFFESLELEDLDWMLHGSESEICVKDWRSHTDYSGFKNTDPQVKWFWEVVEKLNAEQKRMLLFFWTSLKYLPVEGFRGLSSRLCIYNSSESEEFFPSSHTCFYQLCIPPYSSKGVMRKRLLVITQEHVGCSFGTE